jgi:hypothetical protein
VRRNRHLTRFSGDLRRMDFEVYWNSQMLDSGNGFSHNQCGIGGSTIQSLSLRVPPTMLKLAILCQ